MKKFSFSIFSVLILLVVASLFPPSGLAGGISPKALKVLIMDFEGCRLSAYKCPAKVTTIGYGNTSHAKMGMIITRQQAVEWLREDTRRFEKHVTQKAPQSLWHEYDAYVSLCFNCGYILRGELLSYIQTNNRLKTRLKMLDYCHAKGKVLKGLVRRRNAEVNWHKSGNLGG